MQAADYVTNTGITGNQEDIVPVNRPVLMGYSINESAGTPAAWEVKIYDGATVSGGTEVVEEQDANGDTSIVKWFGPEGIALRDGVSVEVVSGTVDVTVYFKTE